MKFLGLVVLLLFCTMVWLVFFCLRAALGKRWTQKPLEWVADKAEDIFSALNEEAKKGQSRQN